MKDEFESVKEEVIKSITDVQQKLNQEALRGWNGRAEFENKFRDIVGSISRGDRIPMKASADPNQQRRNEESAATRQVTALKIYRSELENMSGQLDTAIKDAPKQMATNEPVAKVSTAKAGRLSTVFEKIRRPSSVSQESTKRASIASASATQKESPDAGAQPKSRVSHLKTAQRESVEWRRASVASEPKKASESTTDDVIAMVSQESEKKNPAALERANTSEDLNAALSALEKSIYEGNEAEQGVSAAKEVKSTPPKLERADTSENVHAALQALDESIFEGNEATPPQKGKGTEQGVSAPKEEKKSGWIRAKVGADSTASSPASQSPRIQRLMNDSVKGPAATSAAEVAKGPEKDTSSTPTFGKK